MLLLYIESLDVVFDNYAPFLAGYLIDRGWAAFDPPYRPGGYRIGSDALYSRIHRAAIDHNVRAVS